MNLFSIDNPFWRGVYKGVNLIFLNLLWLICCLPIFTIGASTTAFYYALQKNIKNELGGTAQQFFRGFRENFKQSTIIWLVMFVLCMLFSFDLAFFTDYGNDGHPLIYSLRYIWYVVLFIEAVYFLYVFPYIARFENTTKNVLLNSVLLIIRHPKRLLSNIFFVAFAAFMVWFLPFLIFVAPAICLWQVSIMMEKIYALYMSDEDKEFERRRNTPGEPDED